MKNLNMKNMICPYPVIETKKALKIMAENDTIEVLVDNIIATQNLEKMATELGFANGFNVEKLGNNEYKVTIIKGQGSSEKIENQKNTSKNIVAISSNGMGSGNTSLSRKLMEGFIYSLTEHEDELLPECVIFYNEGVYQTTINEKTADDLITLEQRGVKILSCGLCLDFYNVTEKLKVGEITNMYTISKLFLTHNIININ